MYIELTDGRRGPVDPSALLVFVDETGHEELADPKHPLFGMGGCVVLAGGYKTIIEEPWRELKRRCLGDPDAPLHASDVDPNDGRLMADLGAFFRQGRFGRVATVVTDKTQLYGVLPPYQVVAMSLSRRVDHVAGVMSFSRAVFVFESCERAEGLVDRFFGDVTVTAVADGVSSEIPIVALVAEKSLGIAGLEVADFIVHAAGRDARRRDQGGTAPGKDFRAVFEDVDPTLQSFDQIIELQLGFTRDGVFYPLRLVPQSRPAK